MLRFALIGWGTLLGLALASFHPIALQHVSAQQDVQQDAPPETPAPAAAPDTNARLDRAFGEIRDLRTLVTAQTSRITNLERSVRSLQDQLTTPAGNRWKIAAGWAEIRLGMSRTEVEYILGLPTNVDSVIDRQTLTYENDDTVVGTVILVGDRVSHVEAPGFQIVQPEPGR